MNNFIISPNITNFYFDKIINNLIHLDEISILESNFPYLKKIYTDIRRNHSVYDTSKILNIINNHIYMRLPPPMILLCFPGLKENLKYLLKSFEISIQQQQFVFNLIKVIFPNQVILENHFYYQVHLNYYLPNKKIGFILNRQFDNKKIKIYNHMEQIKIITLESNVTYQEFKRDLLYQIHSQ